MEFENGTFDAATSSFGLFFLEDMIDALNNITKTVTAKDGGYAGNAGKQLAVKAEGKVAITSFTGEAFSPMADIFIKCCESTGREVPPLSWKRLATEELIREQLNEVGITKVDIHHEPLGYQMTDPQMWWDVVWNAGWRALLNQMSEEEQKEFKKVHREEIAKVLGNDGVWFNTEVLIAVGEKQ